MARPERNTVDYFPFLCDEGKKMFYIEETYGNDGFAVFIKLLRELAKTEFHYLDLNNKTTFMFLAAKCKVSKELFEQIINDLVELEKLDSELWTDFRIIWCQDFIDSIQDAYKKRSNNCIDKNTLKSLLLSKRNPKPSKNTPKPSKCKSEVPVNPQSKVEYRKEKKSKEEYLFIFDEFRKLYLGTKKGNDTEFENFIKKTKDWKDVLPILKLELESQISIRKLKEEKKQFVPEWKNLQTWINKRCWEDEITIDKEETFTGLAD